MSAELAILSKANNNSGDTRVIYKEDFDGATMVDISEKFFGTSNNGPVINPGDLYKIVVMK